VRHEDPAPRNILYSHALGRFTIIDFEFAVLLDEQSDYRNEQTQAPDEYNRFEELDYTFDELDALLDSV